MQNCTLWIVTYHVNFGSVVVQLGLEKGEGIAVSLYLYGSSPWNLSYCYIISDYRCLLGKRFCWDLVLLSLSRLRPVLSSAVDRCQFGLTFCMMIFY